MSFWWCVGYNVGKASYAIASTDGRRLGVLRVDSKIEGLYRGRQMLLGRLARQS